MNEPTIKDGIIELGIFEKAEDAWTTSRDLARIFEKEHFHVIRDIERILSEIDTDFGRANFGCSSYKSLQNKKMTMYNLTRKGFTLVAMGFTGRKAMAFKVQYIEAFETMVDLIGTRILSKGGYKIMSGAVANYLGKDARFFRDEANRVNMAVLGMTAVDFRESNGLKTGETPRDMLVKEKLEKLDSAQRLNASLITAGVSCPERSRILEVNYNDRPSLAYGFDMIRQIFENGGQ